MSFWDDLSNFGGGLLDDVGEGFGNLVDGYTKPQQSDVTTNPNTYWPNQPTYADNHGNTVTTPQGQQSGSQSSAGGMMGFSNQQLMIGGLVIAGLLLLTKR